MSADESRPPPGRRARPVEQKVLAAGPAKDLRDMVYRLYAEADRPPLAELAQQIADDDDLSGSPGKDLISKIISGDGLGGQQDTVTVAVILARAAGRRNVAEVAEQIRQQWIAAATADPAELAAPADDRLGRAIHECDPLALEVHPAIQGAGNATAEVLPGYVPRAHDRRLQDLADAMLADGRSRLVTLVGGSSTGKTRACWELVRYLEQQRPGWWRVWHPFDPTRPEAALADLANVGPDTVVWLNEAQHYLMPTDLDLGERIAAGLRTLLTGPDRGPVLVLATLWPDYWSTLTTRPADGPDVYGQTRDLLTLGTKVTLSDTFTATELAGLAGAGVDIRLRDAAAHAEGGRITQYLAGAPALEDRYRTAVDTMPAARAILQVAIDARRLGHPVALPHALLEQVGPGYLDGHDWDACGEDWLEAALAYTAQPCKGARGPLTRIRPRPGAPATSGGAAGPRYRLADYLEQLGRTERAGIYPPDSLWAAFAAIISDPDLLNHLGQQAEYRGRYQHAIWQYTAAAAHGDTNALQQLARLREQAGDTAGAETLLQQAADRGDTNALQQLARLREQAGDAAGAETLAVQAADRNKFGALHMLARLRERYGDAAGAEAVALQAADGGVPSVFWDLAELRVKVGDIVGAEALYRQAAERGDITVLRFLAVLQVRAGDIVGAEALAVQAANGGDTSVLLRVATLRVEAGDIVGAEALYRQAADRGDIGALPYLATLRVEAGDIVGAEALYRQAADRGDISVRRAPGAEGRGAADAEALAVQAVDHGEPGALYVLARLREEGGDTASASQMRGFGLTGSGDVAAGLDFGL